MFLCCFFFFIFSHLLKRVPLSSETFHPLRSRAAVSPGCWHPGIWSQAGCFYLPLTALRETLTYTPAFPFPHKASLSLKSVCRATISQVFSKAKPVIAPRRPPYSRNHCRWGPQQSTLVSAGALLSLPSPRYPRVLSSDRFSQPILMWDLIFYSSWYHLSLAIPCLYILSC